MNTAHRPLTFDERFFSHTTIVNVPVSIPSMSLAESSAVPVDNSPMALDLTWSNHNDLNTFSGMGTFMSKNWGYILVAAVFVGSAIWYYKKQEEKSRKIKSASPGS